MMEIYELRIKREGRDGCDERFYLVPNEGRIEMYKLREDQSFEKVRSDSMAWNLRESGNISLITLTEEKKRDILVKLIRQLE
jgi:hypothetical protein